MCCTCPAQTLYLFDNQIGDPGVTALAQACAGVALPQLKELYLQESQISDAGITALCEACATGAMAQLTVSSLPSTLSLDPKTRCVGSPDSDVSYGVQYPGS